MKKETFYELIIYVILGSYFGLFIENMTVRLITVLASATTAYFVIRKKNALLGLVLGFVIGMIVGTVGNSIIRSLFL